MGNARARVFDAVIPDAETKSRMRLVTALLRELRPKQWLKNFACFAGLVFSGRLLILEYVVLAVIGFVAFCCASSAVYIFNDLLDRENDRLNPRTAGRPLASGALPVWLALVAFGALAAGAGLGSFFLGWTCLSVICLYGTVNVLYSVRLKHTVIADVICIALGFILRVLYGTYAIKDFPTSWIVLCMFFLALFLGFAKRKAELACHLEEAGLVRTVLNKYHLDYLNLLIAMCATMAIMAYALFTVATHKNPTLVVTAIPVAYCVFRYMHIVIVQDKGQEPEDIILTDRMLGLGILSWLVMCIAILYFDIKLFVEVVPVRH